MGCRSDPAAFLSMTGMPVFCGESPLRRSYRRMESTEKETMGIAETRDRKRPCKSDGILRRPLPMGSDENVCGKGNLKRKAVTGRTCQLLRLLSGTSCFEVMLNRRMPNGTYWWCERGIKFPLLD